jgi:hypothetical protein
LNVESGQHPVRGATKEKTKKLDELKAKRIATADKKKVNTPRISLILCMRAQHA